MGSKPSKIFEYGLVPTSEVNTNYTEFKVFHTTELKMNNAEKIFDMKNDDEIVEFINNNEIDVKYIKYIDNKTNVSILGFLINKGFYKSSLIILKNPNIDFNMTSLSGYFTKEHEEIINEIFNHPNYDPSLVHKTYLETNTIFIKLCKRGKWEMALKFIQKFGEKCNLNYLDEDRYSALMYVIMFDGPEELVLEILKYSNDKKIINALFRIKESITTSLLYLLKVNKVKAALRFIELGFMQYNIVYNNEYAYDYAILYCLCGDKKDIEKLLTILFDQPCFSKTMNNKYPDKKTVLHHLCKNNVESMALYVIKLGLSMDNILAIDDDKKTAYDYALENNMNQIIEFYENQIYKKDTPCIICKNEKNICFNYKGHFLR